MSIFTYDYMIRALIVGFLLSIIIPFMGIVVVNKKISVIGDALSHVSLAGVMLGLMLSVTPIYTSIITCVIAGIVLELIRKNFPGYEEISTAIIMSVGIGAASILAGFVKKSSKF
ncbi:ABC 3 transport domain protein [Peptoniphilus sp. BV3C26]|nr:ABC 3 transport domain protein [Peptoniphilus sp. BV3C26]